LRRRTQQGGLTVNAIAGTHVVFFGLDLTEDERPGFRGFAFKRFDHDEQDTIWLQGMKRFEQTEPHPAKGERFSTRQHPIQSFQWADYSVHPGRDHTYTVAVLYGDPASLEARIELEVEVTTEPETGPVHSAFFNRGSVATQEYARRFENRPPSKAGLGAYKWLSRGLLGGPRRVPRPGGLRLGNPRRRLRAPVAGRARRAPRSPSAGSEGDGAVR